MHKSAERKTKKNEYSLLSVKGKKKVNAKTQSFKEQRGRALISIHFICRRAKTKHKSYKKKRKING